MYKKILIKRFSDGRLYNTETGAYVSLADLAEMLASRQRIIVQDAETGEDITGEVLYLLLPRS
jgi:polyhydroxyalkanoate synthesis regulator protein